MTDIPTPVAPIAILDMVGNVVKKQIALINIVPRFGLEILLENRYRAAIPAMGPSNIA